MLGLSGKRRTDRLTVDLAELGTQMSFARAARELAGTSATPGQAHGAVADVAALMTGPKGTFGAGHHSPDVVMWDGTGVRAGTGKNGTGAYLAIGLGDSATQPQSSFPSTSVSLTVSSLQASDSRAISALAASSS